MATNQEASFTAKDDSLTELEHHQATADEKTAARDTAFAGLSRYETIRTFWVAILLSSLASFGAIFDAYCFAVGGGLLANAGFTQALGTVVNPTTGAVSLDAHITSIWSGCASAMLIAGHFASGYMADIWGRKMNMYAQMVLMVASIIAQILAKSWGIWLLARILLGIAVGMIQVNTTMYVAEIAPAQIRGAMIANYSLFFGLGQLFAAVALQVIQVNDPMKYKNALYSQFLFVGLNLIFTVVLPESPWYLAHKSKHDQAKASLLRINGRVPAYDVEREYSALLAEIETSKASGTQGAPVMDIFRGKNLRRTLIAALAIGSQQVLGTALYFIFSTLFFQAAGLPDPFLASLIIYILLNFGIICSFFTTELVGRRTLMVYGCGAMALLNVCLAITGSVPVSSAAQKAALAVTCLWVLVYAVTAAPVGFVVAAEIGTPRLRAATTGAAVGVYGALNLIFTFCIPLFLDSNGTNWGLKAGYLFGGLSAIATVLLWLYLPETAGRTFAELDELFEANTPSRAFGKTTTALQRSGEKA